VTLLSPIHVPRMIERDADDDHVIAAAVAAHAELIVTGDRRHLLPIGTHQGIAILTAQDALTVLSSRP
jgi:predicted nucleic acid-binding protein